MLFPSAQTPVWTVRVSRGSHLIYSAGMGWKAAANLFGPVRVIPLATVYLTEACNSRCTSCSWWKTGEQHLTLDLARQAARELEAAGCGRVLLTGGEPLLHPRWLEIADQFDAFRRDLATNGLLVRRYLEEIASRFQTVYLSLDGSSAETYRAIRGVDAVEIVIDAAAALQESGVEVLFRSTLQRANLHEVSGLVERAAAVGTPISFLPVDVSGDAFGGPVAREHVPDLASVRRAQGQLEQLDPAQLAQAVVGGRPALERVLAHLLALAEGRLPHVARCNATRYNAVIRADGRVRSCHFLPDVGHLDDGLPEALNTGQARAVRRAQERGERAECTHCSCPMYLGVRALLRAP